MAGVNKVILVGNAGRDPEVRFLPSGNSVANFTLATTENWNTKEGGREDRTEWHRICAFGRVAEHCAKSVSKGKPLYVEGRLQTRQWEDKEGVKRYTTEIVASQVQVLDDAGDVGKAVLLGRVEKTPEVRHLPSGTDVANFTLLTRSSRQGSDGDVEERTESHRVVAFGKTADVCGRYLTPGKLVYIEGRIQTREWQDKDGNPRVTTEIIVSNMQMVGGRGDAARTSQVVAEGGSQSIPAGRPDDEIPF
jgi:single-strand DNA-binding protein